MYIQVCVYTYVYIYIYVYGCMYAYTYVCLIVNPLLLCAYVSTLLKFLSRGGGGVGRAYLSSLHELVRKALWHDQRQSADPNTHPLRLYEPHTPLPSVTSSPVPPSPQLPWVSAIPHPGVCGLILHNGTFYKYGLMRTNRCVHIDWLFHIYRSIKGFNYTTCIWPTSRAHCQFLSRAWRSMLHSV